MLKKIYISLFLLFSLSSCLSNERIRNWDIHMDDISTIIRDLIDYFIAIAWTISVIFIIIWAYQILFGSVTEGSDSKWKETVTAAIIWFAISALSWFIVKLIFDNLS